MVCLYQLVVYTDYVGDVTIRYVLGWIFVGCVILNIVFNLQIIIANMFSLSMKKVAGKIQMWLKSRALTNRRLKEAVMNADLTERDLVAAKAKFDGEMKLDTINEEDEDAV